MSFDLYGLFDLAAQESGQVIDPDDPLAPLRQRGGVNLSQAGERTVRDRQAIDRSRTTPRRPQPFATGVSQVNPFAAVQDMQQYHGRLLGGMAQQTMSAWQDEHDSRVSQARDMQRMMHEQEMERIRQEALLRRLEMEREMAEKERIARRQRETGIVTRQLVNGRWTDV